MTKECIEQFYAKNQGMEAFARAIEAEVVRDCVRKFNDATDRLMVNGDGLTNDQHNNIYNALLETHEKQKTEAGQKDGEYTIVCE